MKIFYSAAQLAMILLITASANSAPAAHHFKNYSPTTFAGLLKNLKESIFGFRQDIEFSAHSNSASSGTAGISQYPGSQSTQNTYSDYSPSTGNIYGITQVETVLPGHPSLDTSVRKAQLDHDRTQDILNTRLEVTAVRGRKVASGLLKSVPNDGEKHVFPPISTTQAHNRHTVTRTPPKHGLIVPEQGEETKMPSKRSSFEVSSKPPSVISANAENAPDENGEHGLSHEDYAHAFVNGLAPSAGASKISIQSATSPQVQAAAYAPVKEVHASVVSNDPANFKAMSPLGLEQTAVSENVHESAPAAASAPEQVPFSVLEPVANLHTKSFSSDPAHFKSTSAQKSRTEPGVSDAHEHISSSASLSSQAQTTIQEALESPYADIVEAATDSLGRENEISHEDYAHAFINGLAPSAGVFKRSSRSVIPEKDNLYGCADAKSLMIGARTQSRPDVPTLNLDVLPRAHSLETKYSILEGNTEL